MYCWPLSLFYAIMFDNIERILSAALLDVTIVILSLHFVVSIKILD